MFWGEILTWFGWAVIAIFIVTFIVALAVFAMIDGMRIRPADLEFDDDAFLDAEPNFTRMDG